jgi:hypothetical protein
MTPIDEVVRELWPRLVRGEKIHVAQIGLEHPGDRPDLFTNPRGAWPDGQRCDFVWRLSDGSRIHAQCYGEGERVTIRLHRDHWDPEAGLVPAVLHFFVETPLGRVLGLVATAVAAFKVGQKYLGKAGSS